MGGTELQKKILELQQEVQQTNNKLSELYDALEKQQAERSSRPVTAFTNGPSESLAYEDLVHRYGHHLNRGVEGLLALWRQMGGEHGWSNYCLTPDQLTLLLSRDETPVVHLRVGRTANRGTHGTYIEEADVRPFFCQILSRLPNLKRVMLTDSPVSPFDWKSIEDLPNPFPQLRFLMLWSTPCSTADLLELEKRVPCLTSTEDDPHGGVRVNRSFLYDKGGEAEMIQSSTKICVYD